MAAEFANSALESAVRAAREGGGLSSWGLLSKKNLMAHVGFFFSFHLPLPFHYMGAYPSKFKKSSMFLNLNGHIRGSCSGNNGSVATNIGKT